ncbi:MAG: repeat protein [Acidobacteria bacterium]|nr:repeat protein [Acidobacteriota bacterium]
MFEKKRMAAGARLVRCVLLAIMSLVGFVPAGSATCPATLTAPPQSGGTQNVIANVSWCDPNGYYGSVPYSMRIFRPDGMQIDESGTPIAPSDTTYLAAKYPGNSYMEIIWPLGVACWAPGTYTVKFSASCAGSEGGSCYWQGTGPLETTFVVSPVAVSISAARQRGSEFRVNYDYGPYGSSGTMTYVVDGGSAVTVTDPECHHPTGTCVVPVPLSCGTGAPHTLTFSLGGCPGAQDTQMVRVECDDDTSCNRSCPMCVAAPVNVGSGNVKVTVPLFTVNEPGRPLSFELTYDSVTHPNESLIRRPLGLGWTHPFNMQVSAINPTRLQYVAPDGETQFFDGTVGGTTWTAGRPATSTDTITLSGGQYILRTLAGDVSRFDAASGNWQSTADRYGNTFTGSYTGPGNLTTITDPLGRVLTLSYTGTTLDSVTMWDNTTRWQFQYAGAELSRVSDPIHGGASWRSFAYTADNSVNHVTRLLTSVTDDGGALLEGHAYDLQDRGTTSVSAGGRDSFAIEYDQPSAGQSRVTETRAGVTQVSVYSIRSIGGIFRPAAIDGVCSSCGGTTDSRSFTYDPAGHVLSSTDGEGHTTAYTYDGNGNVASRREAAGTPRERTTTYEYSYGADPTFMTRTSIASVTGNGTKTSDRSYNTGETLLTLSVTGRLPSNPSPVTYTSTATYDARHRLTQLQGPRTDVATVSTYVRYGDLDSDLNRRSRLQSTTDAAGLTTTYENYDLFGTPGKVTDANGVVTLRSTDGRGRVVTEMNQAVSGDANETADYTRGYLYDSRDRLTRTSDARGFATQYAYEDGANRLVDTIRVDGGGNQRERRHFTLDASGHVTTEEDQQCATPAASCTSWTTTRTVSRVYDQKGRSVETDYPVPAPGGAKVLYAYDRDGKLSSLQDEDHAAPNTIYAYDELERLTNVTQTLSGASGGSIATTYAYDLQDNLVSVTDPNGNATTYAYDDFNRLQTQTSPVTGTTSYTYDPAGNLTSTTDAHAATTARTYDSANRVLTAVSTRPGNTPETVSWTYDDATSGGYGLGRVATMTDPAGATRYLYERRGLLRRETRTGPGAYTTGFSYDANGNRTVMIYPSGRDLTCTFDYANRPSSATAASTPFITSASYLPFGPQTSLVYVNGLTQTQQYDQRYRLTRNTLVQGAATIADHLYAYDKTGNITEIHDGIDAGYNRDFGYDDLNRLTTANTGPLLWGAASYQYDAMGNMTRQSFPRLVVPEEGGAPVPAELRVTSFAYQQNSSSRNLPLLATVGEQGVDRTVYYGAAGNEIAYLMPRTYSARNLLTTVQDGWEMTQSHRLDYGYDGRGVRVSSAEQPAAESGGTANRFYVYSPELQLLAVSKYDTPNVWGNARRRIARNDFADPRFEIGWFGGEPVAQRDPSGYTRFTFTDHLGTPILQTDYAGTVIWQADYEPFGNVWQMRAGTRTDQPLRFPGQEVAMSWEGSEENYNIFRWYRSGWGRYTQADPAGLQGGLNLYAYAAANAVRYFDPFGLCRIELRFSAVGPTAAHAYHAYITTTDSDGTSFFRGGPSGPGGGSSGASGGSGSGSCCRSSGGSGNSSNGSSPGSGGGGPGQNAGPYGPIIGTSGRYGPGTIDYPRPSEIQPPPILLVDDGSRCVCNSCFQRVLDDITARAVPYNPFLWNSNSTVHELLQRCHVDSSPPPYWTPAWSNALPGAP